MTDTTTTNLAHVRIRSKDTHEDPFKFLFPKPKPHPVILDHLGNPSKEEEETISSSKRSASLDSQQQLSSTQQTKRPKLEHKRPSSAEVLTQRALSTFNRSSSPIDTSQSVPNIIQSISIVQNNSKAYTTWFINPDHSNQSEPPVTSVELVYLTKTYRETFSLLRPKPLVQALSTTTTLAAAPSPVNTRKAYISAHDPTCEYDPVFDLIETIRMLVQYSLIHPPATTLALFSDDSTIGNKESTPPLQGGILRRLDRARNRRSLPEFVTAVNEFNKLFAQCKRDGLVLGYTKRRKMDSKLALLIQSKMHQLPPAQLVHHLLYQAYSRAVAPFSELLRKYDAFSNTVYGEINPIFVDLIIDKLHIQPSHTFIDLGSGIGNVVLHIAARTECTAYGVEIQPVAAELAQKQLDEFRCRMKYVNRRLGHVELLEGDMLKHPSIPKLISKANAIFCNNYVFQPELNRALLELFLDLQDGTRLVSLREFSAVGNQVTMRNYHSLEALFDVECFTYPADYVSWTDQPDQHSLFVYVLKLLPLKAVSRMWGYINNDFELPRHLRPFVYKTYAYLFNCKLNEMQNTDLYAYKNLGEFFYRQLDMAQFRPLPNPIANTDILVSPADGYLLDVGRVYSKSSIEQLQIKGVGYSVNALIHPTTPSTGTELNDLYYAIIYLSPGDYHRFHSPTKWQVHQRKHIYGELLSVNPKLLNLIPSLFTLNERVALLGTWQPMNRQECFFAMVPVGATNVGSVCLNFDPLLKTNSHLVNKGDLQSLESVLQYNRVVNLLQGAEMGGFKLGSTVVLLFQVPKTCMLKWLEHDPLTSVHVKVNEPIAYITSSDSQ